MRSAAEQIKEGKSKSALCCEIMERLQIGCPFASSISIPLSFRRTRDFCGKPNWNWKTKLAVVDAESRSGTLEARPIVEVTADLFKLNRREMGVSRAKASVYAIFQK